MKTQVSHNVNLRVLSHSDKELSASAEFAIVEKITCPLPHVRINKESLHIPLGLKIEDNESYKPAQIDLLIGADLYFEIIFPGLLRLGKNMPTLQYNQLGWIVGGQATIRDPPVNQTTVVSVALFTSSPDINDIISRFWTLEEYSITKILTPNDKMCELIFVHTTNVCLTADLKSPFH